jgi:hypothetical protein
MIRVQPARSRIVKIESPDRITLEMPAAGILSVGALLAFLSLVWVGLAAWGGAVALEASHPEFAIIAIITMLPGLLVLVVGAALCRRRWRIERSAFRISFEQRGLLGTSRRSWKADDVSTVYAKRSDFNRNTVIVLGFRNGRSEDVVEEKADEDMQWVAAMLGDPRGQRPTTHAVPLQTPAPARVRADESIVPTSLRCAKDEGGVDLSFLALIHFKRRWWRLLAGTILGTLAILGAAALLHRLGLSSPGPTRIALGLLLVVVLGRMLILNRTAIVRIRDGVVTIVQNQWRGEHQFPAEEVEFIQTFRGSGDTELQFLRRGKPKLRLFRGRPGDELEWAARFLRVALRAKSDEASGVSVDAAAGLCQVCGEKMETRVVYCARCRTPHHEECWTYVGNCSTYACREIRFTRE